MRPGLVPPHPIWAAPTSLGLAKGVALRAFGTPAAGSYVAVSATARQCPGSEEHGGAAGKEQLSPEFKAGGGRGRTYWGYPNYSS